MIFREMSELEVALETATVRATDGNVEVGDARVVREELIDNLVWTAVFGDVDEVRQAARERIHDIAWATGAIPSSIQALYAARGRGEIEERFTVPAFNLRILTYETARAVFRTALELEAGAFIFEIARSEIGYTEQRPAEYAACILGAAVREGWKGPVFIQGDHFQASAKKWFSDARESEIEAISGLIREAINAEFYNIDIDTSTLVQLEHESVDRQQKENYEGTARFARLIRETEPEDVVISIGGEIGEVGAHNTKPEEFRAYIDGFRRTFGEGTGISKVSIQTGTSHGGVPLPDGSVAEVSIDFDRITEISRIAREEYQISGAVQHGASTLPEDVFDQFPKADTVEIHLATGFQNVVYDHERFPETLTAEIVEWLGENAKGDRKDGQTEEQFIYKARKRALGPFKKKIWSMPSAVREAIMADLEEKFELLMTRLGVDDTRKLVDRYVPTATRKKPAQRAASSADAMAFVVEGEGE
ncbi:MAG: class II fructose-bisphosphate aldolase [Acidobacteria bacterium]|nr:class II fructose-bisphosphate aldolase [Acidobacteriota bacterium]